MDSKNPRGRASSLIPAGEFFPLSLRRKNLHSRSSERGNRHADPYCGCKLTSLFIVFSSSNKPPLVPRRKFWSLDDHTVFHLEVFYNSTKPPLVARRPTLNSKSRTFYPGRWMVAQPR
ncbi:hypothetical protein QL285_003452 [Trifolium repens]|nr:hypothetical protein QL285_003452 [Trifolium repens]